LQLGQLYSSRPSALEVYLAGTSMAVVEGAAERGDLIWQEVGQSGWILLMAQICIIPWNYISVLIMKRNEANFFVNC
jgi:hypothetical protein